MKPAPPVTSAFFPLAGNIAACAQSVASRARPSTGEPHSVSSTSVCGRTAGLAASLATVAVGPPALGQSATPSGRAASGSARAPRSRPQPTTTSRPTCSAQSTLLAPTRGTVWCTRRTGARRVRTMVLSSIAAERPQFRRVLDAGYAGRRAGRAACAVNDGATDRSQRSVDLTLCEK